MKSSSNDLQEEQAQPAKTCSDSKIYCIIDDVYIALLSITGSPFMLVKYTSFAFNPINLSSLPLFPPAPQAPTLRGLSFLRSHNLPSRSHTRFPENPSAFARSLLHPLINHWIKILYRATSVLRKTQFQLLAEVFLYQKQMQRTDGKC